MEKCGNKVSKFRVCNSEDCGEGNWQAPNNYEYFKLLDINDSDIDSNKNVNLDSLTPDCYDSKCENKPLLKINIRPNNELITEHYYLVDAVKKDDYNYLREYYTKNNENINKKLEYGYPGNTILHDILYYNSTFCLNYILTLEPDFSIQWMEIILYM